MGMNEILYCDLDGTLIRDNLEGAFVAYLRRRRELSVLHYAAAAFTVPVNAFRRRFFLPHPFKSWTAFRSASEKRELISRFLENEGANISFAPNVLRFVEDFKGKKVLLTGSDEDLAAAFLKFTERSDLFDEVCGSKIMVTDSPRTVLPSCVRAVRYSSIAVCASSSELNSPSKPLCPLTCWIHVFRVSCE